MSIDGKCQHDDLRVMGFDELPDPEVGELVNKDGFFDQREVMADDIEEVPGPGITVDQSQIKTSKKVIDPRSGFRKRVSHHGPSATTLNRLC
jgi:hypothetical protein